MFRIFSILILIHLAGCSVENEGQTDDRSTNLTLETETLVPGELSVFISAAEPDNAWSVRYRTGVLVDRLIFPRSSGDYRRDSWSLEDGFEIIRDNNLDTVQRIDGSSFDTFHADLMPYTDIIHGDYTPFLNFSDGSMVFFTGQLAVGQKPFNEDPQNQDDPFADVIWFESVSFTLDPGPYEQMIAQGLIQTDPVTFTDDSGEFVYLGDGEIEQSPDMNMIFDPNTPDWIRDIVTTSIGPLSNFYQEELFERNITPLLITTYGELEEGRWSLKGDVIANQVVMSLEFEPEYATPDQMGAELQTLFAHEVAHLWQRGQQGFGWFSWIHEGGAEAVSRLGLEATGLADPEDTQTYFNDMVDECSQILSDGPYQTAHNRGHFWAGYRCGSVIHLSTDQALKSVEQDGLIAFLRDLMARDEWDGANTWRMYLQALNEAGAGSYAETLEAFLMAEENAPDVQALLTSAGYRSE